MIRKTYIGLATLLMLSGGLYAQSNGESKEQEGEIVMTREELKSFLHSVAEAKLKRLEEQRKMENELRLAQAKAHYYEQLSQRQAGYMPYQGLNYQQQPQPNMELLALVDRLSKKINQLENQLNTQPKVVVANTGATPVATAPTKTEENKEEIAALNSKFDDLKEQLKNAKTAEERRSLLEELLKKYGNFKKQVFFANNSSRVPQEDMEYINDVVDLLKQHSELSIVLEGYASPTGRASYNKQLSMRRAESVQTILERKGISPARIVAAFKGEDHSGSEAHARRVDMSVVIK